MLFLFTFSKIILCPTTRSAFRILNTINTDACIIFHPISIVILREISTDFVCYILTGLMSKSLSLYEAEKTSRSNAEEISLHILNELDYCLLSSDLTSFVFQMNLC